MEWEESWQRAGWLLEPLAAALLETAGDGRFQRQDFAVSTDKSLMAWDAGQRAMALKILELLPASSMPGGLPQHLRQWGVDKPRKPWYNSIAEWVKALVSRG